MAQSTRTWIPYATKLTPLNYPDLPEWDSIIIGRFIFPIEGIPRYAKHLDRQKKRGPGQDNHKITAKGSQPPPMSVTLKLWVDILGGPNYMDLYRQAIPILLAPRFDKRFAVAVYHPVLQEFGLTSAVFFDVPTPQHAGGRIFHVELQADNAADIKDGTATKEIKQPNTNAISAQPAFRGGKFGLVTQTIPRVDGTSYTEAWQARINTPSSRSGVP